MKIQNFLFIIISYYISSCRMPTVDNTLTLSLLSFEDKNVKVSVHIDYVNEKMTLRLRNKDSVCFHDFKGLIDEIKISDKKFITLSFYSRGGTGVKIRRYTEIYISKDRMYDAIDLYSLIRSEFNQTYNKTLDSLNFYNEISVDSLSFFKENSGASDYKLYIRDENTRISKVDKDSNYHKVDTVKLNFNKTYKVFCNTMATLKGPYLVEDRFGSTKEKQFAQNIYPAIRLSNFEYYYIEGSWHLKGHENYLTKVSIDCR